MTPMGMTKEIADLNLAYMLQAQKQLREDRDGAMQRLGLAHEVADLLVGLSLADLLRLAASNFVVCATRH